MELSVTIGLILLAFLFGFMLASAIYQCQKQYYKNKYDEIKKDVDKKAEEIIQLMDIEQFKTEKELSERKYKSNENDEE